MSQYNKAKGTRFETDLEDWINHHGGLRARRLPRAGAKDIGDLAIELGGKNTIVVEAKNCKTQQMAKWLDEAAVECVNYEQKYPGSTFGVVITKTRQKSISEARVTMTLEEFSALLLALS